MKTTTAGYHNFRMDDWLLYCNTLGGGEKLTYSLLRLCSRGKDHAYPKQEWLSERMKNSEKQVRRYLKNLEDQGFISSVRKKINGYVQNCYFFLAHPMIPEQPETKKMSQGKNYKKERSLKNPGENYSATHHRTIDTEISCFETENEEDPAVTPPGVVDGPSNIKKVIKEPPNPPREDAPFPELAESGGVNFSQPEEHPEEWQTVRELHLDLRDTELVVRKPDSQTLEIRHPNRFQLCHLEKKHGTAIRQALLVFGIMRTVFRQDLPQGEGQRETSRTDQRLAQLPLDQQFDLLLKEYPKKPMCYKRNEVRRSFLALARNGQLPDITKLLSDLRQDRENPVWKVENYRYVPFLGNWLHGIAAR
jgi:DNA-binding Lrp family transcriptional regulator